MLYSIIVLLGTGVTALSETSTNSTCGCEDKASAPSDDGTWTYEVRPILRDNCSSAPVNFGPRGIYPCRCDGSDVVPDNCDENTGKCPTATCQDGSQYGDILENCQIVNIAYGGTGTRVGGLSSHTSVNSTALDGKINPKSCVNSVERHCGDGTDLIPFWYTDLGGVQPVSAVWVLNSDEQSHYKDRLMDIRVSNDTENWQNAILCYRVNEAPTQWYRALCEKPLSGRYVSVWSTKCTQVVDTYVLYGPIICEFVVIEDLYLSVQIKKVTSSLIQISVNEQFYGGSVGYRVKVTGKGRHGCQRTDQPTITEQSFSDDLIELPSLAAESDYEIELQPVVGTVAYGAPIKFNVTTGYSQENPPENTPESIPPRAKSKNNTGVVVGGVVTAVLLLIVAGLLIRFILIRRRKAVTKRYSGNEAL